MEEYKEMQEGREGIIGRACRLNRLHTASLVHGVLAKAGVRLTFHLPARIFGGRWSSPVMIPVEELMTPTLKHKAAVVGVSFLGP